MIKNIYQTIDLKNGCYLQYTDKGYFFIEDDGEIYDIPKTTFDLVYYEIKSGTHGMNKKQQKRKWG